MRSDCKQSARRIELSRYAPCMNDSFKDGVANVELCCPSVLRDPYKHIYDILMLWSLAYHQRYLAI